MVSVRPFVLLLIVSFVLTASLRAQTSITLTKPNAQDVLVTINGAGPFDVFRSQSADLTTNTETLSSDQAATTYTDAAAQQATAVVYYYDVVGPGESSLASGGAGVPQQTVVITSLTPNTGAEGATVTIAGSGFSQHYPENFVTFNGRRAVRQQRNSDLTGTDGATNSARNYTFVAAKNVASQCENEEGSSCTDAEQANFIRGHLRTSSVTNSG